MKILTNENFLTEVLKGIVLVEFYTTKCILCKIIHPSLRKAKEELNSFNVKVCVIDAEENSETSVRYDISAVPTVILFVDGKVKAKFVGLKTKNKIVEFVKNSL